MATHNAHNLYGYMNDINANIMKIIVTVANNYSNYNGGFNDFPYFIFQTNHYKKCEIPLMIILH